MSRIRIPRDSTIAVLWLVALEAENLTIKHHHAPLALDCLLVAVMALAAIWRRRAPLTFVAVVLACAAGLVASWRSASVSIAPLYVLFVPPYTAARERSTRAAAVGLAAVLAWGIAINAATKPTAASFFGTAASTCAAWAAGRWLRARGFLNEELERKAERICAERESRVRLAVADERTRIARELHTLVAANVSAMVIQAEAAELLLDGDPDAADRAMAAVEHTGRAALSDMRRVLGVLRHADESPSLAPQPGIGQIYALVESARGEGRSIDLTVEGEPGPLPASVDLGIYRILEDALRGSADEVGVRVRFGEDDVALDVTVASLDGSVQWPTLAMSERVAICNGVVNQADGRQLCISLPRELEEVFA
jgi:signal transduction histidine kinase